MFTGTNQTKKRPPVLASIIPSPRLGGSKGLSTVIGTIFFVLVVLGISSTIFLYTMAQNALYNQAVKESYRMDQDRFSERVVASHASYAVLPPDTVVVDVTISNEGPIAAQVITMWVAWTDGDVKKYGHENELDIGLDPGDKVSPTISVTVPGVQSNGTFSGWLVTARGNLVALEKQKTIVTAQVSAGIGSITMNFTMFKYYNLNTTDNSLIGFPEGKSAFKVPSNVPIAFGVYLSNYDPEERTIILKSGSSLWAYAAQSATPKNAWWYIVNVDNGKIAPTYTPVSIAFGQSKWLFFASLYNLDQRSFAPSSISGGQFAGSCAAVNLLLVGTIGGEQYGQNIPFVSIYVE